MRAKLRGAGADLLYPCAMLSSHSRLRFLLLVGLASCRQACGLTLAEDGSGGGGANAGGGGANAGGGGANVDGGGGAGAGASNTSTSSANGGEGGAGGGGGGAGPDCEASVLLRADFDTGGEALELAGCTAAAGGTCATESGEFRITPSADTGFWNGGESSFVHFVGATHCDSFLAHTLVEFDTWPLENQAFSLAGLVLRDSACPIDQGPLANCNHWFKAEVGRLSALPLGYPSTTSADVGLRSALHNLAFGLPPAPENVQDIPLPPTLGQYQVAICADLSGATYSVEAAVRLAIPAVVWSRTSPRDLEVAEVQVGLVAARDSVSGFTGRFEYFEILPQDPGFDCADALESIELP